MCPGQLGPSHFRRVMISEVHFYFIKESALLSTRQMRLGTFPPRSLPSLFSLFAHDADTVK